MAEPGSLASAPPTPLDSAASAPTAQGSGTAATGPGAARPIVSRGYPDVPNAAEIKALDDAVRTDLNQVKDERARNLNWWQKYADHFDPKIGKWDEHILQWSSERQTEQEDVLSNKLNEDLKKDMRARLGTLGSGPKFEKRVHALAAAMSRQFGVKAAAERAATEIIKEAYKSFDDAAKESFDVYIENLMKPIRDQRNNQIEIWRPSSATIRASKIFHNKMIAAVRARIDTAAELGSKARVREIKDSLPNNEYAYAYEIDAAVFAIRSEELPLDQRVDALIRRVLMFEQNYFPRLSHLIEFYPSDNDKFKKELRKNDGYKKIIKDFAVKECFQDRSGQPLKAGDAMARTRDITNWIIIPEIAKDVLRAAEKYAQDHHIDLPAKEIKALYDKIDNKIVPAGP